MTDELTEATRLEPRGDHHFFWQVPDGWQQGRGAFGGLSLGAMARAMIAGEPDADRPLRSLSGEILGPVLPGDAAIRVEVHRRGNAVTNLAATLTQNGEVLAHASAVLARARAVPYAWTPAPPPLDVPWQSVEDLRLGPPFGPTFARFLELRPTGPLPFSGAREPVTSGWVRMRRAPPSLSAPELVALADAWWPGGLTLEEGPRPVGTIAFTVQLFPRAAPLDPAEPLFHRARAVAAHEGYQVELRELWTPRGELVAMNQQTIAWIR